MGLEVLRGNGCLPWHFAVESSYSEFIMAVGALSVDRFFSGFCGSCWAFYWIKKTKLF